MLLDCLGTLLALEPPAPRLVEELSRRGISVSAEEAAAAFRVEIRYYLGHHLAASDRASLERLRDDCARVLREALGLTLDAQGAVRQAMLAALRFRAYPDVAPALRSLRAARLRLVVVSNWDCSLGEVLDHAGLRPLVDGVVTSAEVGAAKPDPAIVRAALEVVGAGPDVAVAVGDSADHDVAAARAAGVAAVLLRRAGAEAPIPGARGEAPVTPDPPVAGVPVVRTLEEARSLILPAG